MPPSINLSNLRLIRDRKKSDRLRRLFQRAIMTGKVKPRPSQKAIKATSKLYSP